jgi:TolB protein
MRKLWFLGAAVAGLIGAAGGLWAQDQPLKEGDIPVITVTGEKQQVPVAIPAFVPLGGSGDPRNYVQSLRQVLTYDLAVSGFFKVLDPKSYIAPAGEGIEAGTIRFPDWFNVGAQILVKTGFTLSGGSLRLEGRVYEVSQDRGKEALSKSFSGDASDARHLTHLWANAIVKYFTNEDGIFTTRIAYTKRTGSGVRSSKNIYVVDFDGHGRRALTQADGLTMLPRWSPDGAAVIASTTIRRRWEVVRISLRTGKMKTLSARRGLNLAGSYSPDGSRFVATLSQDGNSEIYLLSASGEILLRLTDHWAVDTSPTFSPDGRQIAWVSDRPGSPQIYVMNADGSGQRRLTFRGAYNQEPDWSPKGDKIVFSGRDARGKFDIFTVDVSSGAIERLTQGAGQNEHPKWSPDGRHIVFSSTRGGGGSSIWLMMADGSNQRPLPGAGKGASTPAWSPRP